jgi:hypothetical protein
MGKPCYMVQNGLLLIGFQAVSSIKGSQYGSRQLPYTHMVSGRTGKYNLKTVEMWILQFFLIKDSQYGSRQLTYTDMVRTHW